VPSDITTTSPQRHRLPAGFWIIWTTVALDLIGFGIVVPILGRYAERFGANPFVVGLLFASFSLAQFVFAPIMGRLSDRVGRKPVILISLFGTAIGSLITGAAGVLWLLFLGRIIDGASGGSLLVAQAAAFGLLGAAFGVGFIIGPALGAVFLCIGIVLVIVQGGMIRPLGRRIGVRRSISLGLSCNAAGLVALAFAHDWAVLVPALGLLTLGQGLVAPNFTAMISDGVDPGQRGEALGFQQSASALGRVAGPAPAGFLFHRVGVPAPYLIAAALCGFGLAILSWSPAS